MHGRQGDASGGQWNECGQGSCPRGPWIESGRRTVAKNARQLSSVQDFFVLAILLRDAHLEVLRYEVSMRGRQGYALVGGDTSVGQGL